MVYYSTLQEKRIARLDIWQVVHSIFYGIRGHKAANYAATFHMFIDQTCQSRHSAHCLQQFYIRDKFVNSFPSHFCVFQNFHIVRVIRFYITKKNYTSTPG